MLSRGASPEACGCDSIRVSEKFSRRLGFAAAQTPAKFLKSFRDFLSGRFWYYAAFGRKLFQLQRSRRTLELGNGFGFDLADAFAGHFENSADFFERVYE